MVIQLRHTRRVRVDYLHHVIPPGRLYCVVGKRVACRRCAERLMRVGPKKPYSSTQ